MMQITMTYTYVSILHHKTYCMYLGMSTGAKSNNIKSNFNHIQLLYHIRKKR